MSSRCTIAAPRRGRPGRVPAHRVRRGRRSGPRAALVPAALLLAGIASGACTPLDDAMAAIFGGSMRDQPSFDPYENEYQNALLPPEGSVPFSAGNYPAGHFDVNLGQLEGSADVPPPFTQSEMTQRPEVADSLTNPVPATPESLERGEELYERVCIVCHGPDGNGINGYIFPVAPYLQATNLASEISMARSDGYIYGIIRVGRTLMPPYAHQIAHYDRWHIVNYIRHEIQGMGQQPEAPADTARTGN